MQLTINNAVLRHQDAMTAMILYYPRVGLRQCLVNSIKPHPS
jgi:hypothetical protein